MGFAESSKAQAVVSMEVTDGTLTSGDKKSTYREDGEELLITEVAADPGFAVIFTFSGIRVLSKYANQIRVNIVGWYEGAANHDVQVHLWNYVTEAWESMTGDAKDLPDGTAPDNYQFAIDVQLRDCWPVAIDLDAFTDLFIFQYIYAGIVIEDGIQQAYGFG